MDKLSIYNELKDKVLKCTNCNLGKCKLDGYNPHVIGQGNLDATVMFVAEAPGLQETIHRRPLTSPGTSGILYEKVLKGLRLNRDDVYTTNIILCRPPNNADPMPFQVYRCKPYFKQQLDLVQPKLVVTFGRFSAQTMLGYFKITKEHGVLRHSEQFNVNVFPVYHPAYVAAYASKDKRIEFKTDIKKLKEILRKVNE